MPRPPLAWHAAAVHVTFVHSSTAPFSPPAGYSRIKVVTSFQELVTTRFSGGINALCWQRSLPGDFSEIAQCLGVRKGITTLDDSRLRALPVSAAGRTAAAMMHEDLRLLREHGLAPVLDCINGYDRDEDTAPVITDVYSFHADSATVEADTYLCTYHGAPSEGLRNEDALRRVDIPETRAELLKLFGGPDNDDFREYLRENCFDLHYAPLPHAQPFSFGLRNLWRIAVDYPGSPVPPCIHRAPNTLNDPALRLLLIS